MGLAGWTGQMAAVLAATLVLGGCVPTGDAACSAGERYDDGFCLCEPPRMLNENGRCEGSEDVGEADAEGYGGACDSDADCSSTYNTHCEQAPAGDRYCTHKGCASNGECPLDSYCVGSGDAAYCKRYPTGLGGACSADAECAGQDAAFCTVGAPKGATCVEVGCSTNADCPPDTACNDYTSLMPGAPIFCGEPLL